MITETFILETAKKLLITETLMFPLSVIFFEDVSVTSNLFLLTEIKNLIQN